jgi:hypothetical protein
VAAGAQVTVQSDEARREAALGIEAYWRGTCQCAQTQRGRRRPDDYVPAACRCQPHKVELIDREGYRVTLLVDGRRVPEPFTHLAVRVEHHPYRRIVLGTIADDCLANSRELPDPEITAMTEPGNERDNVYRSAHKLPKGEKLERSGLRPVRTRVLRGTCPACSGLSPSGEMCLTCKAATERKPVPAEAVA